MSFNATSLPHELSPSSQQEKQSKQEKTCRNVKSVQRCILQAHNWSAHLSITAAGSCDAAFRRRRNPPSIWGHAPTREPLFLQPTGQVMSGGLIPHRLDAAKVREPGRWKQGLHFKLNSLVVALTSSSRHQRTKLTNKHNIQAQGSTHSHMSHFKTSFDLWLGTASIHDAVLSWQHTLKPLICTVYIYACVYLQPVSVHMIKHMWS